jgi:deazaflavin-dependent oxidoreductase (nitroreductase family)
VKRRVVTWLQLHLMNPPVRGLLSRGIVPSSYALLETTGRKSGRPRVTPVGSGLEGDTFWIVAEHGHRAGYVRNIRANPRVRVRVHDGFMRSRWRSGTAHVLEDDDPRERQRIIGRGHRGRALNAAAVRLMGSDLLTVRIDLDSERSSKRGHAGG